MTETKSRTDRFRHWPDLTFFYGLSVSELLATPNWLRDIYIEELPRLKAQQKSLMIDAASFPNMKTQDQKRIMRKLQKDMEIQPERASSHEDAKSTLSQVGIAVKTVDPSKGKSEGDK